LLMHPGRLIAGLDGDRQPAASKLLGQLFKGDFLRRDRTRPQLVPLVIGYKRIARHATQIDATIVHGRSPSRLGVLTQMHNAVSILTPKRNRLSLHSFSIRDLFLVTLIVALG